VYSANRIAGRDSQEFLKGDLISEILDLKNPIQNKMILEISDSEKSKLKKHNFLQMTTLRDLSQ
jgi:hypothetical protein